jgi:hypothetical protein
VFGLAAGVQLPQIRKVTHVRFSIRQLLLLVAYVAVACISLRFAGPVWWTVLSGAGLLLFMGILVVALAGRGDHRTFAIGSAACVLTYGVLLFLMGNAELRSERGWMPTTIISQTVYRSTVTATTPPRHYAVFMRTAHLLWAALLGWIGGLFACFIDRRSELPRRDASPLLEE